ncbi:MAG TPA: hypothetical protein VHL34_01675 [Rhizomicrobium sp.]|jgi:hypothetical protein|nr:hypothetical protein [Rhizomicrobium sp.]
MKPRKRQASGKVMLGEQEVVWELLREAHYSSDGYKGMVFTVRAQGERTYRELLLQFPYPERKPGFHQDKERIVPQTIEAAINLAVEMGWRPKSRGRSFILEIEPGDLA